MSRSEPLEQEIADESACWTKRSLGNPVTGPGDPKWLWSPSHLPKSKVEICGFRESLEDLILKLGLSTYNNDLQEQEVRERTNKTIVTSKNEKVPLIGLENVKLLATLVRPQ
ncbi:hypothetical protein M9H77_25489 [Catharanthus roseus]|uniref:Uncharacterized protein n=1 Tax=Catharanthus roseus TaxID=4058 RepID=A0ACC0A7E9_CATRO|nr:hypothetical protein M9H77_25489 [Catharanthus roseus]